MRATGVLLVLACCSQREPSRRHADPIGAATRCARAISEVGDTAVDQRQRVLATACADTVVEKGCRDAWLAFDVPPSERADHVYQACRAAYCPILPDPKPAACGETSAGHADRARAMAALQHAIRIFDLGRDAAAIIDAATPAPPPPQPRAPAATDVRWRVPIVTIGRDAIELAWRPPTGPDELAWRVPMASWTCTPLRDVLAAEVAKTWPSTVRPSRSKQLLIGADRDAPYELVFRVMECVRAATVGGRALYPDVMLVPQ